MTDLYTQRNDLRESVRELQRTAFTIHQELQNPHLDNETRATREAWAFEILQRIEHAKQVIGDLDRLIEDTERANAAAAEAARANANSEANSIAWIVGCVIFLVLMSVGTC